MRELWIPEKSNRQMYCKLISPLIFSIVGTGAGAGASVDIGTGFGVSGAGAGTGADAGIGVGAGAGAGADVGVGFGVVAVGGVFDAAAGVAVVGVGGAFVLNIISLSALSVSWPSFSICEGLFICHNILNLGFQGRFPVKVKLVTIILRCIERLLLLNFVFNLTQRSVKHIT